ncbi:hypothetical protein Daura_24745 [Dactylosporangium aurantiacum]|uniref:Aspartate/glutamate/uridylate kinase domain-containing protein n=1 Tax=Dactylosporangium aurantiacum TaxID=35754 RepID=A0A9Q9IP54_9ACTN|nr:hypothetical protein [Dactylosporangium aurantiacum]MDG6103696.1 hypothetical protein [Dactylosporangium aurantiacum]UWZ59086.1 hypothetical protein Daura_24745 [Dactylosporangium aurantiacum]
MSGITGEPTLLVLKVGGSVLTDKYSTGGTDYAAIDDFAARIADLHAEQPGRIVLVTGGGPLCHPVGMRIKADRADAYAAVALTEPAFAMRWAWTTRLRAHGVRAVPLQVSAMYTERPDGTVVQTEAVERLLRAGALPVLSSDFVVTAGGTLRIFSSDEVPALFTAERFRPLRVVALSDVPGILTGGGDVLPEVDPHRLDEIRGLLWNKPGNATGAMDGKVAALAALARDGVECVIARGERTRPMRHLLAPMSEWPPATPRTLIAVGAHR